MHERKKQKNFYLSKYSIKKVYYQDYLFKETVKYLKKQKHLRYSKIIFWLNSFINKTYPVCYILKNENKIVGFVGTIFSKKKYNNFFFLTCNIHSWLVDKDHRIASSLLLKEIEKKSCLITVLSSLPKLKKTFVKLGFKELTMKYKLIFIKNFFLRHNNLNYQIVTNFKKIKKLLPNKFKKLLLSYSNKAYKKFLFLENKSKKHSFIIGRFIYKKKYLKTLNLIYCSNTNFINKNLSYFFQILSNKFSVSLCGEYYISKRNAFLSKNTNFSLSNNKKIYLKKIPKHFTFDLLYTENEF